MDQLGRETAPEEAAGDPALVVDFDRAFLRTDPFHERLFHALKARPADLPRLLLGRSARRTLAEITRRDFSLASCPREPEVERLIETAARDGRPIRFRSRDETLPDDGDPDLRRLFERGAGLVAAEGGPAAQAERLQRAHPGGYVFVGQSEEDLPLWRAARERYGVNLSARLRRQARDEGFPIVELARRKPLWQALLRSMRPHQWLKNLLLFVPFALSLENLTGGRAAMGILAFMALCLLTSGTYIVNDLFDVEADRRHPRKRNRPIASGDVPLPLAATTAAGLIAAALLGGALLRPAFAAVLLAYLAVTLAYSFRFKRMAIIDVIVIAGLFTLRILAGMLLVSGTPSHWLLMFSIFFFLSLAFMKREVEFNVMHQAGRQVLQGRGYAIEDRFYVLCCGLSSGMASMVIFALFISEMIDTRSANYGMPDLLWGALAAMSYWMLRMWLLTTRGLMNDDPILFAARDRTSLLLGGGCAMLACLAQFIRP